MNRGRVTFGIALAISVLASPQAYAQEKSPALTFKDDLKGNQSIFAYDFGVPQSPALHLLGLQSGSVTPASTLKALVAQASSFTGGPGQTIAVEMSPAAILGLGNNLGRYARGTTNDVDAARSFRKNYLYRLARRLHLGAAALVGNTGENAVKSGVSLGATVSILDSSDPWGVKFSGSETLYSCIINNARDVAPLFVTMAGQTPYLGADRMLGNKLETFRSDYNSVLGNSIHPDANTADGNVVREWAVLKAKYPNIFSELTIGEPDISSGTMNEKATRIRALASELDRRDAELRKAFYLEFEKDARVARATANIKGCTVRASNAAQYGTDLTIGGGAFWRGKPGELSELRNGGGAIWAAFRTSAHTEWANENAAAPKAVWLIAASSRYGIRETIATGDKTVANIRADTLDGWAGIERRSPDFFASARVGYQQVRANEAVGRFFNRQGTRFLLNAQQRVTDQMWLSLSYGNAGGSVDTYDAKRFLVSIAFSPPKPDNIVGTKD